MTVGWESFVPTKNLHLSGHSPQSNKTVLTLTSSSPFLCTRNLKRIQNASRRCCRLCAEAAEQDGRSENGPWRFDCIYPYLSVYVGKGCAFKVEARVEEAQSERRFLMKLRQEPSVQVYVLNNLSVLQTCLYLLSSGLRF